LTPGSFAAVMAVGIVSSAASDAGRQVLSEVLLACASLLFAVMTAALAATVLVDQRPLHRRLREPSACFGAYAFGTAAVVLAVRLPGTGFTATKVGVWVVTVCLWIAVSALVATSLRRATRERAAATGEWLLAVVAVQSATLIGAAVAGETRWRAAAALSLVLWAAGVALYPIVAGRIVARLLRVPDLLRAFSADHWVLMGAAAISGLAGARLLQPAASLHLAPLTAVITAVMIAAWATATLAYQAAAAVWLRRWARERWSRRFEPAWWSLVFPLGMYSVCTDAVGTQLGAPVLRLVATGAFWLALVALGLVVAARFAISSVTELISYSVTH
jgi:tellurite resistance protein TehA-like permease